MSRFGADVVALTAIAGGVILAVGATTLMADGAGRGQMQATDRHEVRVEVRKAQHDIERVRERAERARARAERARARAHQAADRADQVRSRIDGQVARGDRADVQWRVRFDEDFDFDFDFDFDENFDIDFDYDFEAGELRLHLEGIEGLENLTLDLTELELQLEGLGEQISGELEMQLDGLDAELEDRLEEELRRLAEELGRVRVEVRGR